MSRTRLRNENANPLFRAEHVGVRGMHHLPGIALCDCVGRIGTDARRTHCTRLARVHY